MNTEIGPEMRLLLLCCINNPSMQEYQIIYKLVNSALDWNFFCKLVVRNRVYSIIYKNLKVVDCNSIHQHMMSFLRTKDKENRMKILLFYVPELVRVMKRFNEQGIRAISVKGPLLSLLIYNDITVRMSKDLDILVGQADISKAESILLSYGYEREGFIPNLTLKQRASLIKSTHHFSYVNKNSNINIELHWKFNYESYNYNFNDLWAAKSEVVLGGVKISILNREENFLYLVFHGSKHMWARLKWLGDVAALLKQDNLDWNSISARAKRLGIEHLLEQTLVLSNLLFMTDTHEELFNKKKNHASSVLVKYALFIILNPHYDPAHPGSDFYILQLKYMMIWTAGFGKKLSLIRNRFYPTEKDFAQVKISDRYFMVYFFVRFFLMVKRKWHTFVLADEKE